MAKDDLKHTGGFVYVICRYYAFSQKGLGHSQILGLRESWNQSRTRTEGHLHSARNKTEFHLMLFSIFFYPIQKWFQVHLTQFILPPTEPVPCVTIYDTD